MFTTLKRLSEMMNESATPSLVKLIHCVVNNLFDLRVETFTKMFM